MLYTLDQFWALYTGSILCCIYSTNSVLYTLDQFRALYIGPILCFIHWTNSKTLLVWIQGFPDEGTPRVPKHDTYRKETVYRLCLLLVHELLVWRAECEKSRTAIHRALQLKYQLPTKPVTLSNSPPHTHTHTHTNHCDADPTTKHTAFLSFTMFYVFAFNPCSNQNYTAAVHSALCNTTRHIHPRHGRYVRNGGRIRLQWLRFPLCLATLVIPQVASFQQ